jgi:hypothetical protein
LHEGGGEPIEDEEAFPGEVGVDVDDVANVEAPPEPDVPWSDGWSPRRYRSRTRATASASEGASNSSRSR